MNTSTIIGLIVVILVVAGLFYFGVSRTTTEFTPESTQSLGTLAPTDTDADINKDIDNAQLNNLDREMQAIDQDLNQL